MVSPIIALFKMPVLDSLSLFPCVVSIRGLAVIQIQSPFPSDADWSGAWRGHSRAEPGGCRWTLPHKREETKQSQEAWREPGVHCLCCSPLTSRKRVCIDSFLPLKSRFPRLGTPLTSAAEREENSTFGWWWDGITHWTVRTFESDPCRNWAESSAQRCDERESVQRGGLSGGRCPLRGRAAAAPQRPEWHPELQRRVVAGHREGAQQESADPGRHQPGRRGRAAPPQQTERTGRGSGSAAERDGKWVCEYPAYFYCIPE